MQGYVIQQYSINLPHFIDKETEALRGNNLPRLTQLGSGGVDSELMSVSLHSCPQWARCPVSTLDPLSPA